MKSEVLATRPFRSGLEISRMPLADDVTANPISPSSASTLASSLLNSSRSPVSQHCKSGVRSEGPHVSGVKSPHSAAWYLRSKHLCVLAPDFNLGGKRVGNVGPQPDAR